VRVRSNGVNQVICELIMTTYLTRVVVWRLVDRAF